MESLCGLTVSRFRCLRSLSDVIALDMLIFIAKSTLGIFLWSLEFAFSIASSDQSNGSRSRPLGADVAVHSCRALRPQHAPGCVDSQEYSIIVAPCQAMPYHTCLGSSLVLSVSNVKFLIEPFISPLSFIPIIYWIEFPVD